tara:strand:+ start:69 stop:701 length:633 start_codon:yes stop_codon:yes gene_type:complete
MYKKKTRYLSFFRVTAICFFPALFSAQLLAQSLKEVTEEECVYGSCGNGRGTLSLKTPWGLGEYIGDFRDEEFHGYGRLEIPISFTQRAVYAGNWVRGQREGRGTHWNGEGKLYIGEWRTNKRHGTGSYFFNIPEWKENEHTEFWLKENFENYTGDFVEDHFQGKGTYRWPDGQRYEGSFFASDKHGEGVFYYTTGTSRKQFWHYGDLLR